MDPKLNLDMHLRLGGVGGARFEMGKARGGSGNTYIIRLLGKEKEELVMSLFLQWDKVATDVEESRIEAWKEMKEKYGKDDDTARF